MTCSPSSTPWSSKYRELRAIGKQRSCVRSLPQAFTEKSEVRGVNPVLVRKKAKACGVVLYGTVLGLVVALPGCNANWPPIGSKEEAKLLSRVVVHAGAPPGP